MATNSTSGQNPEPSALQSRSSHEEARSAVYPAEKVAETSASKASATEIIETPSDEVRQDDRLARFRKLTGRLKLYYITVPVFLLR
jgi:hypothetical protein